MSETAKNAVSLFVDGPYNCAEAVAVAFAQKDQQDHKHYISFTTAFGGGIGSLGHLCGAISGTLMMISHKGNEMGLKKTDISAIAKKLYQDFEKEFGSCECSVLTNHACDDLSSAPYDLKNCAKFIEFVVSKSEMMLDQMIAEKNLS